MIERSTQGGGQGGISGPGRTASPPYPSSSSFPRSNREPSASGIETSSSTWASEAALDRSELAAEAARSGGVEQEIRDIKRDSGLENQYTPTSSSSADGRVQAPQSTRSGRAGGETGQTTWDQLRQTSGTNAFPSAEIEGARGMGVEGRGQQRANERMGSMQGVRAGSASTLLGGRGADGRSPGAPSDLGAGRTKEQREFDEMLERERKGVAEDKWA